MNGADAVARALHGAGVDVAFGLPGVHNMPLWPACRVAGVRIVGMRHEQACAYAADGYARATGTVGVALVTTGPGAANTVGAVGEAWASRVPVVVIATDIPTSMRRTGQYRGVLHETTDQAALFAPITKAQLAATTSEEIAGVVTIAIASAMAPPARPVYVGIPTDLLRVSAPPPAAAGLPCWEARGGDLSAALALVQRSERPLIWAGGGARHAGDEIDALARRLGAPVVTTYQARGLLAPDHPLLVTAPPHEPEVTALIGSADLAIVVGSDLDQMNTMGWRLPLPERRIAVNLARSDAEKNYAMTTVIESDASLVGALATQVARRTPWIDAAQIGWTVRARLRAGPGTRAAIAFLEHTEAALPADAVVFADMCIPGYWLAGHLRVGARRGLQFPMGWGTLGYALPAAIGAGIACERNSAPVAAFVGDGGALFALGELSALAEHRPACTVVVADDGGYGMLRDGDAGDWGCDLPAVDFAAVARAFDIEAETISGFGAEYASALARAVESGEPRLLHVLDRLVPPATTSPHWPLREVPAPIDRDDR